MTDTSPWTDKLRKLEKEFIHQFGNLSSEELNWKPDSKSWSIGEVIQHLVLVNRSYVGAFTQCCSGEYRKPFLANFRFLANLYGKLIYRAVDPNREAKTKTFKLWDSSNSHVPEDILNQFSEVQSELIRMMENCGPYLQIDQIIASPLSTMIVFPMSDAFNIVTDHEERHLMQALRVKNQLEVSSEQ